jgi:hypothetical protein
MCQPYFGSSEFVKYLPFVKASSFPKPFNGCLQAIIWKASRSILTFPQLKTASEDMVPIGIPNDVRADALALMRLYVRNDPVIEPSKWKSTSPNDGKGPGPGNAKDKDPNGGKGPRPRNAKGKGSSHHQGATDQAEIYYWSPDMTAAKAMSVVAGWRRSDEQYKVDRAKRERMLAERKTRCDG